MFHKQAVGVALPSAALVLLIALLGIFANPVLAAQRPTYILAVIQLDWQGTRSEFEQDANTQADLFIRESGIDQYADIQVKLVGKSLDGVALDSFDGPLSAVLKFGLENEPADRYIGLTDNDLAPEGFSQIVGWTDFNSNVLVAEALSVEITAHEMGHTYGLCDEYDLQTWTEQNDALSSGGGCPNPFPPLCNADEMCPGTPAVNGNDSIMSYAGRPGPFSYNQPCYDHLQLVFGDMFGQAIGATPVPSLEPGLTPTAGPTPMPAPPLAFTNPSLVQRDPDGTKKIIVNGPGFQPDWSSDGKWIIYASWKTGNLNIFLAQLSDGSEQQLTFGPNREFSPRFIPKTNKFIYVSDESGQEALWLYDLDSRTGVLLPGLPAPAAWPAVSSDGELLAFSAAPDGNWNLYRTEIETSGLPVTSSLNLLDAGPGVNISPDWSFDGKWIVFASDRAGSMDLYLYQVDLGRVTILTDGPGNEWAPRWAKNGQIFYQASNGDNLSIWQIDPITGAKSLLVQGQPQAAWPVGQP